MAEQLGPKDAHGRLSEGWLYVDVRTQGEFDGGHPQGSQNIPFAVIGQGGMMPNPMFLSVMGKLFPPDTKLLVGCASGGRSTRACQMLEQSGFTNLVNVVGGYSGQRDATGRVVMSGWADEGLPTSQVAGEGSYDALLQKARG
jgi:rhodanese-related sulfurtransferase